MIAKKKTRGHGEAWDTITLSRYPDTNGGTVTSVQKDVHGILLGAKEELQKQIREEYGVAKLSWSDFFRWIIKNHNLTADGIKKHFKK